MIDGILKVLEWRVKAVCNESRPTNGRNYVALSSWFQPCWAGLVAYSQLITFKMFEKTIYKITIIRHVYKVFLSKNCFLWMLVRFLIGSCRKKRGRLMWIEIYFYPQSRATLPLCNQILIKFVDIKENSTFFSCYDVSLKFYHLYNKL